MTERTIWEQCGGLRCENHQPAEETDLQRWRAKQERKSSRKEESTREYRSDKDARSRRSPRSSRGRDAFERQDDFVSLLEAEAEDLDEEGPLVCAELVPFQCKLPASEREREKQTPFHHKCRADAAHVCSEL